MVFAIDNEAKRVLPTTWGDFPLAAFIKHQPEDFQVREELGFEPEGSGEHLLVKVRKSELNTIEVAASLAHHAEVRPGEVSYSGLKDRNALTEQWFSIWLGKRPDPDWTIFNRPNCTVITASRHRRKLRRGSHKGNHFRIILRQATGDFETAQSRFNQITERGIPNYFGEQRFGHRRKKSNSEAESDVCWEKQDKEEDISGALFFQRPGVGSLTGFVGERVGKRKLEQGT